MNDTNAADWWKDDSDERDSMCWVCKNVKLEQEDENTWVCPKCGFKEEYRDPQ